ncbi:hypothetical protein TSMEX_000988, partial [Taenia solium]
VQLNIPAVLHPLLYGKGFTSQPAQFKTQSTMTQRPTGTTKENTKKARNSPMPASKGRGNGGSGVSKESFSETPSQGSLYRSLLSNAGFTLLDPTDVIPYPIAQITQ